MTMLGAVAILASKRPQAWRNFVWENDLTRLQANKLGIEHIHTMEERLQQSI